MRLLTFLAGVGAGFLLGRSRASRVAPMQNQAMPAPRGERDWPTHAPLRTDAALRDRIRAQLDRTIREPEAILVDVQDGRVILRGQVQARDSVLLMAEVENAAGVKSIDNQLQLLGSLDEIAPPQGQPAVREAERETSQLS